MLRACPAKQSSPQGSRPLVSPGNQSLTFSGLRPLCRLCQPWAQLQANIDFEQLALNPNTRAALTCVEPIRTFGERLDVSALHHVSKKQGKAAWTVVLGRRRNLSGWSLQGKNAALNRDGKVDALRAEQMAAAWAILWVMQWTSSIQCCSNFEIMYDCLAAENQLKDT